MPSNYKTITTYEEAAEFLLKGRSKNTRRVNATKHLTRLDDDSIAVYLYNTPIVIFHKDNTYSLHTGGWETMTTRRHLNMHLPSKVSVWGNKGKTVIHVQDIKDVLLKEGRRYRF